MAKLSKESNYLARLLVMYIIADFLLTPLGGLETGPISDVNTVGVATLAFLFLGLGLNIICPVLTFRPQKRSQSHHFLYFAHFECLILSWLEVRI